MSETFFDLRGTHNPNRWFLPVTPDLCVGPPGNSFLFGGVGLAAAVGAMERTTGRPVIWATAQYLSYARPDSVLDLDVWTPVSGKYNTQARVVGHVGDGEILTVNAALGERESEWSAAWARPPAVPPPEDCPSGVHWRGRGGDLHSRIEVRVAQGRYRDGQPMEGVSPDGRLVLWVRTRDALEVDAAVLAIVADYVPSGIGNALGAHAGGNSLDNTLRIVRRVPTRWVLCDIQIQAVHGGFGHGMMHLFAEDGTLMAVASQSVIVRTFKPRAE